MMASIPNMRSTPLPVPAGKAAPAGDAGSGGFAVPASPVPEPGQPCLVAPPVQLPTEVDTLDGTAPPIVAPEGGEDGKDGEEAPPPRAGKTSTDDGQPESGVVIPFVPQLPATPVPQAQPVGAPAAVTAQPAGPPSGTNGPGKKTAPAPDSFDESQDDAGATDLKAAADAVVKTLLQRKTPSAKQMAAKPTIDAAKADPAKPDAKAQPASAATPATQFAAPLATFEPTLSPVSQPAPPAAEATDTVKATNAADLAVERKLDLSRDGAWLDRLARDIARSASDDSPLHFRLHPQTLGSLHVELQQGDHGTAVRLTVETEAARQILTDAQPRLTAEARAQGVRIAETHVDLSGSGRQAPGDQRRQDEARQTPLIRTAPGANEAASARSSSRTRADRYA